MANKPAKNQAAAAPAVAKKKINRVKRNAMNRKSLPKSLKIQFAKNTRAQNRALLAAWKESRKKPALTSSTSRSEPAAGDGLV